MQIETLKVYTMMIGVVYMMCCRLKCGVVQRYCNNSFRRRKNRETQKACLLRREVL